MSNIFWDVLLIVAGVFSILRVFPYGSSFLVRENIVSNKRYKIFRIVLGTVFIIAGVYFLITKQ
jgi:threonine/homoserine/homoserine lactone efflux protein